MSRGKSSGRTDDNRESFVKRFGFVVAAAGRCSVLPQTFLGHPVELGTILGYP